MSFLIRPLKPEVSIGAELAATRRRLAIPLRDIVERTKIQRRYLEAIEEDRWMDLPAPIYTRNFLRSYAEALGEDSDYFLSRFKDERGCCDLLTPSQTPRQRVRKGLFLVTPRILNVGILSLVLAGVCTYLGLQIRHIVEPPEFVVVAPLEGSTASSPTLTVTGQVKEEAAIEVNGDPVLPSLDGTFTTTITLERGLNVITIEGKKRYSHAATIYRTVVFDPQTQEQTLSLAP